MEMFNDLMISKERAEVYGQISDFLIVLNYCLQSIIEDGSVADKTAVINECLKQFYDTAKISASSWSRGKVSDFEVKISEIQKKAFTDKLARRIIKYNPNQPRDENGRWVDSGGSKNAVRLPNGSMGKLAPDSKITKVVTFAGKGTNTELRVAKYLEQQYGIAAKEWKHLRGDGYVICDDGIKRHSELHWFESEDTGRIKMKVKRYFDES